MVVLAVLVDASVGIAVEGGIHGDLGCLGQHQGPIGVGVVANNLVDGHAVAHLPMRNQISPMTSAVASDAPNRAATNSGWPGNAVAVAIST
ncbi:hypothetical protein BH23ACT2_BH23ACT2_11250 [soil metagenome]